MPHLSKLLRVSLSRSLEGDVFELKHRLPEMFRTKGKLLSSGLVLESPSTLPGNGSAIRKPAAGTMWHVLPASLRQSGCLARPPIDSQRAFETAERQMKALAMPCLRLWLITNLTLKASGKRSS